MGDGKYSELERDFGVKYTYEPPLRPGRWRRAAGALVKSIQYGKTMVRAAWKQSNGPEPIVLSYGSARSGPDTLEYRMAFEFNEKMARQGWVGRTGGGKGVMEAAARGMVAGGSRSEAVNIHLPTEQKLNEAVDQATAVTAMNFPERKAAMRLGANAFAYFQGGIGTFDELYDVLDDVNTDKIPDIPIVVVAPDRYFDATMKQIEEAEARGMVDPGKMTRAIFVARTVDEAVDHVVGKHTRLERERAEAFLEAGKARRQQNRLVSTLDRTPGVRAMVRGAGRTVNRDPNATRRAGATNGPGTQASAEAGLARRRDLRR